MLSAFCLNLDQIKILLYGNGLKKHKQDFDPEYIWAGVGG